MIRSWKLRNAVEAQREAPYTFYRPSDEILAALKPGHLVKLAFDLASPGPSAQGGERMWVVVTDRQADRFSGTLDNEPVVCTDLAHGDLIEFESIHIIDTELRDSKADEHDRFFLRCLVSRRVLDDHHAVNYLCRDEPANPEDSGWQLLAGDESDDYVDDADNIAVVAIGVLLNRDDSFLPLLESPPGSAFERLSDGSFRVVQ